jgi:hypothetical protein
MLKRKRKKQSSEADFLNMTAASSQLQKQYDEG